MDPILSVRDLVTEIPTPRGTLRVVDGVSFDLAPGECLGIVGESGSGKSMTCRSLLGLVPRPGRVVSGTVRFGGRDLRTLPEPALNAVRGRRIAVIVQDAVAALNPVWRIGDQIGEAMVGHGVASSRAEAREKSIALMRKVGIPAPEKRIDDYLHQFSGGMCQRVVIAAALACEPRIVIADEPTTALDVTIQDQILKLLMSLQEELGLSIILVTHDMGVVAQTCQRVAVMYAGRIVEMARTEDLFAAPRHPYTTGLLACMPDLDPGAAPRRLHPIPGMPPDLAALPGGCAFHPRCPIAARDCRAGDISAREVAPGHVSRCLHHGRLAGADIWAQEAEAPA
jgi:peptide/nickel transport system ATP-binding protein/oligopeptide transport system ATP-binding protein